MLQPVVGSHNPPAPPTTADYGLNLIPPAVQLEGLETQACCVVILDDYQNTRSFLILHV